MEASLVESIKKIFRVSWIVRIDMSVRQFRWPHHRRSWRPYDDDHFANEARPVLNGLQSFTCETSMQLPITGWYTNCLCAPVRCANAGLDTSICVWMCVLSPWLWLEIVYISSLHYEHMLWRIIWATAISQTRVEYVCNAVAVYKRAVTYVHHHHHDNMVVYVYG